MQGVWLLPTREKLSNLRRFLSAAREMGTSTPGLILVNKSEWVKSRAEYEKLLSLGPEGWSFKPVNAETYGEAIRSVWNEVKDFDWIGLVADDLVPCTSIWDKQLIAELQGWNVISSNDGWQAPNRMHGAIVWSGELARTVGWIFPDEFDHIFHDDVWETLGKETGCWGVKMEVMCKHLHEALTGVRGPAMDPNSDLWKHDEAAFRNWLATDKDTVASRIQSLKAAKGVITMTPDFKGVSLFIGTPTGSGRYESNYVRSIWKTMAMLKEAGVTCMIGEEKWTADIALARSKVFSAFVRSPCTHFLMIDDDMGWTDDAIKRLFCAKKDFVAIAGPKKRYPLQFAANYTDDNGLPINLTMDLQTGTMEVGEIGMAFCMITRKCAEMMVQSYPELAYKGATGETEHGLFIPMVIKGTWYSEDFSFCKRWRNIGGSCHMIPDIPLSHTGQHTFEGKFTDTIKAAVPPMMEAAE